jgi:hypothetical protein
MRSKNFFIAKRYKPCIHAACGASWYFENACVSRDEVRDEVRVMPNENGNFS